MQSLIRNHFHQNKTAGNDLTKQQQTWDRLWEEAQDEADGGPAIIQTAGGEDFVWDGVRWRRLVSLDEIFDPLQTAH